MPATSQAQRGLIFGKRSQYKTKKDTPKKWKWIWDEEWENKGKLPEKVEERRIYDFDTFVNEKLKQIVFKTLFYFDKEIYLFAI